MKPHNRKDTLSIILSAVLALALFLILLLILKWNLILCMVLAAAVYIALSLIFKPVKRIGRIEVDALSNGEFLNDRLTEAGSDYNRMQRAVRQIQEQPLLRECQDLISRAGSILKYLTDNPEKFRCPALHRLLSGNGCKRTGTLCRTKKYRFVHS